MITIEIQNPSDWPGVPSPQDFRLWAEAAVEADPAAVVIRIVDHEEGADLNRSYRGKNGPTNVLSFPFHVPAGVPNDLLGDLVICAPVVHDEAEAQGKALTAHWAHLTVHGLLHLQGFDHENDTDAARMEAAEAAILARLGFPDPYPDEDCR